MKTWPTLHALMRFRPKILGSLQPGLLIQLSYTDRYYTWHIITTYDTSKWYQTYRHTNMRKIAEYVINDIAISPWDTVVMPSPEEDCTKLTPIGTTWTHVGSKS